MKLIFKGFLIFLVSLLIPINSLLAQVDTVTEAEPEVFTEIQSPSFTEIKSPVILTAQPQFEESDYKTVKFYWNFGDGNADEGKEVAHTFSRPGKYQIELKTIAGGQEWTQTKEIFVALKAAAFISDQQKDVSRIKNWIQLAEKSNIYLTLIESFTTQSEFLSEEVLARKLSKQEDQISKMDTIIIWTEGSSGLNALTRFKQTLNSKTLFKNTSIILIEDDFSKLRRIKRQFNQLGPKEIIVVPEAALLQLIDTPNINDFKNELSARKGFKYEIIDQQNVNVSRINILSFFLDFLTEKGIPDNTIILILLLPVIATVISFMKQVVGINTLGIYTPTIITLTLLVLGLEFGILLLFFVTIMGALTHKVLHPLKLLYTPKMALVMTSVSIILFLLLTFTVYLNIFDIEFISFAIFPVVIMGTLTEKFVTLRSEKGFKGSLLTMVETFFVALIAYFVTGGTIDLYFFEIKWNFIRNLLLNTPEIIVIFIIINIYLGRWTGLQVTEYFQFKDIINNSEE